MLTRYCLFIFAFLTLSLEAQVNFKATTDARQVVEGGTFEVSFTLENGEGDNFQPPSFGSFRVVSGPSQSYRSTFINGKSSTSIGFTYMLQATKPGKFTIEGATIVVKGNTLRSNALSVEVVKGKDEMAAAKSGDASRIFLRAELDTTGVYIGQQVTIRYKIYTQVNIENYNVIKESSYDGCFSQLLDAYREPVTREVIGGKQYTTKVLRKVSVFPQQSGIIEIDPLVVRIGIPSSDGRRRSFFSNFSLQTKNLTSNAVTLHVRSAYDGAPPEFAGAVGSFDARFRISSQEASTDDAITLQLQVTGSGDVKTIRPPELTLPEVFDQYEPRIRDEKMINATDSVRGVKTIEYLITGTEPGTYALTPSFTYFDPKSNQYRTHTDSFRVTIRQGKGLSSSRGDHELATTEDGSLRPIMYSTRLNRVSSSIILQPWYWATASLPLLGFLFLFVRNKTRNDAADEVTDHSEIARARLEKAREYMDESNHSSFFEEIAFSVKNFISYKLDIPVAELSRDHIAKVLSERGFEDELRDQVLTLLDQCDLALYAHISKTEKMQEIYEMAIGVISSLDRELGG